VPNSDMMRWKGLFCSIWTIVSLLTTGGARAQATRPLSGPPMYVVTADSQNRGNLARSQRAQLQAVIAGLTPEARKYLRYAFVGPRRLFALFVARAPVPRDYGSDSIVLNDCHSGPKCPHLCGTRFAYAENALIPLGPSGYTCTQAWYWKD
jgi:hypothetical protein